MNKLSYLFFAVFFLGSLAPVTSSALAQSSIPQLGDVISLTTFPSQPGPNENIEVNADASSVNLDSAKLTWLVNGKVIASGVGLKSITTTTSSIGNKTTISVSTVTPIGNISKTISIQPTSVHLTWQGLTYAPDFYKGQPLPSSEASLKIVAFPDIMKAGVKIADSALVYTWKINGSVIGSASGYGKNFFIYTYPQISRPVTLEVLVSTPGQDMDARASVTISPTDPRVIIYEESPVLGLLTNRAVGSTFSLENEESRLIAVPYFYSVKKRDSLNLNYQWRVGENPVFSASNDPSALVLRPEKGASGSTQVSVDVHQTETILQAARSVFNVIFGSVSNR